MPKILELELKNGEVWVKLPVLTTKEGKVTLWTEAEKKEALHNERRKCLDAIETLGR